MNPKMTRKEMRREHIRLWRWLAKNPEKSKGDWPGWKRLGWRAFCYCMACEASKLQDNIPDCTRCPVVWREGKFENCGWTDSPYVTWANTRNEKARALAAKIATMWPEEK